MRTIEIDFEVFKALTARRTSETISENDVLREVLDLGESVSIPQHRNTPATGQHPWVVKGVSFSHGTRFQARHKGQRYFGEVDNGALVVNGRRFTSPSAAAMAITEINTNGWVFWECDLQNNGRWESIKSVRELNRVHNGREEKNNNLINELRGACPDLMDGMEFQNKIRQEWNR